MLTHCAAQVEQLRLDAAAEARLRQRTLLLHDEPITGTPVRHEAWARASAATSLCDVVRVALSRALRHTPRLSYLRHTAPRSRARPARWLLGALQPKGPERVRRFKRTSARPSPLRTRHGGAARTSRRSSGRTAARTTSASARATRSVTRPVRRSLECCPSMAAYKAARRGCSPCTPPSQRLTGKCCESASTRALVGACGPMSSAQYTVRHCGYTRRILCGFRWGRADGAAPPSRHCWRRSCRACRCRRVRRARTLPRQQCVTQPPASDLTALLRARVRVATLSSCRRWRVRPSVVGFSEGRALCGTVRQVQRVSKRGRRESQTTLTNVQKNLRPSSAVRACACACATRALAACAAQRDWAATARRCKSRCGTTFTRRRPRAARRSGAYAFSPAAL